MRAIKGKNTGPERRLRAALAGAGLCGFTCNDARLPGRPDFVFEGTRTVIFVDGCFWHGHLTHVKLPKTRNKFWHGKIAANMARDKMTESRLRTQGWAVLRFWECQLRTHLEHIMGLIEMHTRGKNVPTIHEE